MFKSGSFRWFNVLLDNPARVTLVTEGEIACPDPGQKPPAQAFGQPVRRQIRTKRPGVADVVLPARLFFEPTEQSVRDESVSFPISGRAYALLLVLAENAGEVVSVRELMTRVWPERQVDEANLRNKINVLRRVLGDVILNVPGRGYVLLVPAMIGANRKLPERAERLPAEPQSRLIGRAADLSNLRRLLTHHRFVTIVGPGGVGKSLLAAEYAGGSPSALTIDLAVVEEADALLPHVAVSLHLKSDATLAQIAQAMRASTRLLVLDNCEHLADAVATFAGALFLDTSNPNILITSRQSLLALGEREYVLSPFALPDASNADDERVQRANPAVQLFLNSLIASGGESEISSEMLSIVLQACRTLDGLPLAIELCAELAAVHGIQSLPSLLADPLGALVRGRRTAEPRHKTLRAVVDRTYALLDQSERKLFRRLATLSNDFSIADATHAAAGVLEKDRVSQNLTGLVDKSCLIATPSPSGPTYRMFETLRMLAAEKLWAAGELSRADHGGGAGFTEQSGWSWLG